MVFGFERSRISRFLSYEKTIYRWAYKKAPMFGTVFNAFPLRVP